MKRHLLMHVWPRTGRAWRMTVLEVAKRIGQFDGTRAVAVSTGPDSEPTDTVRELLPGDVEVFEVYNDPKLREVATFVPLMERVLNREGLTFYCHGKGSSHDEGSICQEWGRAMCEVLLDDQALVGRAMRRFQVLGAFRRAGRFKQRPDNWHYTGTFFWLDNRATFWTGRAWHDVDPYWYGTEAWPGKMFDGRHAGCALDHCGDLYSEEYWAGTVRPFMAAWRGGDKRFASLGQEVR